MVLPVTPPAPVRAKFKHILSVFTNVGKHLSAEGTCPSDRGALARTIASFYLILSRGDTSSPPDASEDGGGRTATQRHLLECTSLVLQQQDNNAATWASPTHLQAFQLIMFHFDDRRPKIRRAAHQVRWRNQSCGWHKQEFELLATDRALMRAPSVSLRLSAPPLCSYQIGRSFSYAGAPQTQPE